MIFGSDDSPSNRVEYLEKSRALLIMRCEQFEAHAGVPRPCPKCGGEVHPKHDALLGWEAACSQYPRCRYETRGHAAIAEMWREHEINCRKAEEDEG